MNEIEPDAVEAALDGLGVAWKKREGGWAIPATARTPCEIDLVTTDGGLRIEGVLATWDAAGETELAALSALLRRAEADLKETTFEVRQGRAVVAVQVSDESELAGAVSRVFTASRLLSREAAALLEREIADRYLAFFGAPEETPAAPARI